MAKFKINKINRGKDDIRAEISVPKFNRYSGQRPVAVDWCAVLSQLSAKDKNDISECINNSLVLRNGESGEYIFRKKAAKTKPAEKVTKAPATQKKTTKTTSTTTKREEK